MGVVGVMGVGGGGGGGGGGWGWWELVGVVGMVGMGWGVWWWEKFGGVLGRGTHPAVASGESSGALRKHSTIEGAIARLMLSSAEAVTEGTEGVAEVGSSRATGGGRARHAGLVAEASEGLLG